jgi:Ca-activated chloride channel family protein
MFKQLLLLCMLLYGFTPNTIAQTKTTRILFVLDGSGSMYARMDTDTRINIAKRLLNRMVDSLKDVKDVELALRVYGHKHDKHERNCKDTKLEVPFHKYNHLDIREKITEIKPKGTTLIAYSLQEAAYDFPKDPNARNIIILITDGIEECDGDPCAVSAALQKQGIILKPFIIGIGLDEQFRKQFECVGKYFEASTEEGFQNVLGVVISQALNNTTSQVNLLDAQGRAVETDVPISFYDAKTKRLLESYVHTMNDKGLPDTLFVDPAYTYDMVVHTIPPVEVKNINLISGRHNIIAANTPQGNLTLSIDGISNYNKLQALVRLHGSNEIINVQDFNTDEKYITGSYDIEILSLPRSIQENVSINQSQTTNLKIPQPGKLNFYGRSDIIGGIYQKKNGKLIWVCNVKTTSGRQVIVLQPGNYYIISRKSYEKNVINTKRQDFEIESGKVTDFTNF